MAYFCIKDISKGKTISLRGEMIVETEIEFESLDHEATSRAKPKPKIPKIVDMKWILPSQNSEGYEDAKQFAEAGGFQTVEQDEFPYPGRKF